MESKGQIDEIDTQHAVEIADRVWWVGHYMHGDDFQSHTYLIENGSQSVLIDPGSQLTFSNTLSKIEEVIPFSQIRYFICHHQDPDIASAMPLVEKRINREDCLLVTHGRAAALLKHYDLKIAFWLIEENNWKLKLEDRQLNFVFTPYLHFPGAFCTFDSASKILYSSNMFGAFTDEWSLFAKDEKYFEYMRPFHEHYMPAQEILLHGLLEIEKYPIDMIAPQHGSIIKGRLVNYMIDNLKKLDCGLYLINKDMEDIQHLSSINQTSKDILRSMVSCYEFRDIASNLLKLSQRLLPVELLEFFILLENEQVLHLTPRTHYRGDIIPSPPFCDEIWLLDHRIQDKSYTEMKNEISDKIKRYLTSQDYDCLHTKRGCLSIPLFSSKDQRPHALAIFHLSKDVEISAELDQMIGQLSIPLAVATEREAIHRMLELERDKIYESSTRDPLTSLYTRSYMQESVHRLLDIHNRDALGNVVLVICDIDHFKLINDTYGHIAGDNVLRTVGRILFEETRSSDIPVRLGGEEFAVFIPVQNIEIGMSIAERLRQRIQETEFVDPEKGERFSVNISVGISLHRQKESLLNLIKRADDELYKAKKGGRNQVCVAMG